MQNFTPNSSIHNYQIVIIHSSILLPEIGDYTIREF